MLVATEDYSVCPNLQKKLLEFPLPPPPLPKTKKIPSLPARRSDRHAGRTLIKPVNLKRVVVSVGVKEDDFEYNFDSSSDEEDEEEEKEEEEDDYDNTNKRRKNYDRRGHKQKFVHAIIAAKTQLSFHEIKPDRGRNDMAIQFFILLLGRCVDGKALQENKFNYLSGNRLLMKDILCLLDYIRGIAAIKLKVDNIDTINYYDVYRTESEVKEEDFISLEKLIRQLSTVKNCRAITT